SPTGPFRAYGFGIDRDGSPACGPVKVSGATIGWAARAVAKTPPPVNTTTAHSIAANARPGGRPSGNRTIAEITRPNAANWIADANHSANSPPGRAAPGRRLAAPYALDRCTSSKIAPGPAKCQSIG